MDILNNLHGYKVVLASGSPRRKELLAALGVPFVVRNLQGIDEGFPAALRGAEIACHIAGQKARANRMQAAPDELLITADTIVEAQGQVLGKPADEAEATEMLQLLSGRTHRVHTGVCLDTVAGTRLFSETTEVDFAPLSAAEIACYVQQFHPLDKAGAYGIQEWIGYIGVRQIRGCFYNVMGLPLSRLFAELKALPPA